MKKWFPASPTGPSTNVIDKNLQSKSACPFGFATYQPAQTRENRLAVQLPKLDADIPGTIAQSDAHTNFKLSLMRERDFLTKDISQLNNDSATRIETGIREDQQSRQDFDLSLTLGRSTEKDPSLAEEESSNNWKHRISDWGLKLPSRLQPEEQSNPECSLSENPGSVGEKSIYNQSFSAQLVGQRTIETLLQEQADAQKKPVVSLVEETPDKARTNDSNWQLELDTIVGSVSDEFPDFCFLPAVNYQGPRRPDLPWVQKRLILGPQDALIKLNLFALAEAMILENKVCASTSV